jgi:hypothetical protein
MKHMPLAKISGVGLMSIGTLVAILWACIVGEQLIVQSANREFSRTMTELRQLQMQRQAEPASTPAPLHRVRPSLG